MIHVEKHGAVVGIRMARSFLGRPVYWTTAYWVDGLLIDTGPKCTASELVKLLETVYVDQVVVTHSHEDQIGGLHALRERYPDAAFYASRASLPILEDPSRLHLQMYRRLVSGTPEPVTGVASLDTVDNLLQTSECRFRVIETPGHTRDHICLFEPEHRWLFSGDAYMGGPDQAWPPEFDMFGIISSLRTLASLHPERLFPSSGDVRRTPLPDLHQKVQQLIDLARAVARLQAAGLTIPEMVSALFKEEPKLYFWTRGHFSAVHLIEACMAYNAIFSLDEHSHDSSSSSSSGSHCEPPIKPSGSKSSDSSAENQRGR